MSDECAQGGAAGVDEPVDRVAGAVGDEVLVEFVGYAVEADYDEVGTAIRWAMGVVDAESSSVVSPESEPLPSWPETPSPLLVSGGSGVLVEELELELADEDAADEEAELAALERALLILAEESEALMGSSLSTSSLEMSLSSVVWLEPSVA